MTEHETFERRLEHSLRSYAAEVPVDVLELELAREIAVRHPRARRSILLAPSARGGLPLAWALLAGLIVLASIAALLAVGAIREADDPLSVEPVESPVDLVQVPTELNGTWWSGVPQAFDARPAAHRLDFRGAQMQITQDGPALPQVGSVTEIRRQTQLPGGLSSFTLEVDGPCGTGTYTVEMYALDSIGFVPIEDPCHERVFILTEATWGRTRSNVATFDRALVAGDTYDSGPFGEPFTFIMPAVDGTGSNEGLPGQFADAKPRVTSGQMHFLGPWWSMRFVDDMPLNVDICDGDSDLLPDVPRTPEEVGAWLEADQPLRARSWRVTEAVPVEVDGRLALRWDLLESAEDLACHLELPVGQTKWGEMLLRFYAIPTGDDTILLAGGSDMVNFEAVGAVMDGIVRSMRFR